MQRGFACCNGVLGGTSADYKYSRAVFAFLGMSQLYAHAGQKRLRRSGSISGFHSACRLGEDEMPTGDNKIGRVFPPPLRCIGPALLKCIDSGKREDRVSTLRRHATREQRHNRSEKILRPCENARDLRGSKIASRLLHGYADTDPRLPNPFRRLSWWYRNNPQAGSRRPT
jgi:hypothetical protein